MTSTEPHLQIDVALPGEPYAILVGPELLGGVGAHVRRLAPHQRALVAIDSAIACSHGAVVCRSMEAAGFRVATSVMSATERTKTLASVDAMYEAMLGAHLERRSPVVAVGGGIVGDTAGFAAATYLRGVPLIHVPTTLLAMVDASIGGKTGLNHALPGTQELGKNLIGAFWQPRLVIADPWVLATLPERIFRCGLAECVKHAMLADPELLADLRRDGATLSARDPRLLAALVARSARIKVEFVTRDVHEAGERALLNLGHTFAHAMEPVAELGLLHGEAVSIGLRAAMHASVLLGRATNEAAKELDVTLGALRLPMGLPRPAAVSRLMGLMSYDKKLASGRLRLILPRGLEGAEIVDDVATEVVERAWRFVGAE